MALWDDYYYEARLETLQALSPTVVMMAGNARSKQQSLYDVLLAGRVVNSWHSRKDGGWGVVADRRGRVVVAT